MNVLKSKGGMTLVEVVIAILIFSIVGITLISGFSTAANITTKGMRYKNASTNTSSTLELEEVQTSKDVNVTTTFGYTDSSTITYSYKNGTVEGELSAEGIYGLSKETGTGLTYKEFYPNILQFDVAADDISPDNNNN